MAIKHIGGIAVYGSVIVGLYLTSLFSYLLFHGLVELFSIVVAFSLFLIAWFSREYLKNPYLLFIGIAYLFIGGVDLLHTLAYKGMQIFTDYDYYANQLWIGARYMESISLLAAFVFLRRNTIPAPHLLFVVYSVLTALLFLSIFHWKTFPVCFVENQGLTAFKKISEYVICLILAIDILLLISNQARFEREIFTLLLWSFIFTILSELAFTFYISNYGFSNLVGHYFKLFSFFLVCRAIVISGMKRPYSLIFRELNCKNAELSLEIASRQEAERRLEQTVAELRRAMAEIKNLSGLLPICSSCKKIRDDNGSWRQLESYIRDHSDADFSHGICPECLKKYYPDMHLKP